MIQRIALVTGANKGIGFEIARQLCEQGYHVLLSARTAEKGEKAVNKLREAGHSVDFLQMDVADSSSIEAACALLSARYERLDVLVNNAGVALGVKNTALTEDAATSRLTMETNFFGPWLLCRLLVPLMRINGYGRIVNITSGHGTFAKLQPNNPSYRVSKMGLNALTLMLADELREENILVNAVTPGWVRTHMGGIRAPRSAAQGASDAVWLATLPDSGPRGTLFKLREPMPH